MTNHNMASFRRRSRPSEAAIPLVRSSRDRPRSIKSRNSSLSTWIFLSMALFLLLSLLVLLHQVYHYSSPPSTGSKTTIHATDLLPSFLSRHKTFKLGTLESLQSLRRDFERRYGGHVAAQTLLDRSVHTYDGSINATAARLIHAKLSSSNHHQKQPFVMAFAGYSVTVGRGNYFSQSFPFVLERLLRPILRDALDVSLVVRNSAIGGIPSFPYGWCLTHFLGSDADVISWDYSMNEGHGANVLESYIRQSLTQLPHRPMLILLDSSPVRSDLVKTYVEDYHLLPDAIRLEHGPKVVPNQTWLEPNTSVDNNDIPEGYRDWDQFGAPEGCPGRGSWHPRKKQHELMGYVLAMHMLQCVERAYEILALQLQPQQQQDVLQRFLQEHLSFAVVYNNNNNNDDDDDANKIVFPKTVHAPPHNPRPVLELLNGHDSDGRMRDISCRTSFLPAVDEDKILPSVVVSGMYNNNDDPSIQDIMVERTDAMYQRGWVLDVSKVERDTKRKVEKCGGLGYIDMKIALYGIPESGTLRLWLPYEGKSSRKNSVGNRGDRAAEWFDDLVVCEANEKRNHDACQLHTDMEYVVGGVTVPASGVTQIDGAGVYLHRKTCVHVGVPVDAKVTRLGDVQSTTGAALTVEEKQRLAGNNDDASVGLLVDLTARPTVSRSKGACCLSHIIWEQP